MDDSGSILMRLVGIDVPHKINNGEVDVCCTCGEITISGIYEFKDPSEVFFADEEDEDENNKYELDLNDSDFGEN